MTTFAVVATRPTATNGRLGVVLSPARALATLRAGDVALGRLDVLPTLDGMESGSWALDLLEQREVTVLNGRLALATAHDKLATAEALERAGVPHPVTAHVAPWLPAPEIGLPVVLKPRFGSWGLDVTRCESYEALRDALASSRTLPWFTATGGVVQALVPPRGYDLRVLVAGGEVVGAVSRLAAPGEWRTNIALGGRRVPTEPPPEARELAVAAAAAVAGDLVGVDLLPTDGGGWTVLEVNGAADFTAAYSLGEEVFTAVRAALLRRAQLAAGPELAPA